MVQHQTTDIEVQCLPGDIPAFIEVDMLEVVIGQIVHLSDITLPEGVVSVALTLGEAHDLALLLRAGALAAPVDFVEERTVGPSLGAENIALGVKSVIVGLSMVVIFMLVPLFFLIN